MVNADYGKSFPDVIQGLEHIIENLDSDQISAPSGFKYRIVLEKQVKLLNLLHSLNFLAGYCMGLFDVVFVFNNRQDIEIRSL